jgi:ribose-phosphate pyrophosphokinase
MTDYNNHPVILYGTNGREYAKKIHDYLSGANGAVINNDFILGDMGLKKFPCGEPDITIGSNVRERNVYVVQCCKDRVYDAFELLAINDAARRASAKKIVNVIPTFPFARQDRKARGRQPITAKMYAKLLETTGANRICTMDMHADQEQGFFEIPCDNLQANYFLIHDVMKKYDGLDNVAFVAADEGSLKRMRQVANSIPGYRGRNIVLVDKGRQTGDTVKVYDIIGGNEASGKHAIILDDEIDTAGTFVGDVGSLMSLRKPPEDVTFYATHGTLSDPATERLEKLSRNYKIEVVITDTIPHDEKFIEERSKWLRVLPVYPAFAHTIDRTEKAESVSEVLFSSLDQFEKALFETYPFQ